MSVAGNWRRLAVFAVGGALVLGLAQDASALPLDGEDWDAPPFWRFLGRLHAAVVHFPIALITMAAFFELLSVLRRRQERSEAAFLCITFGASFALVAALFGWINGDHETHGRAVQETLFWHRWTSVGATVSASLAALFALGWRNVSLRTSYRWMLFLAAALTTVGGHIGGTMIYGEDYLLEPFREQREVEPVTQGTVPAEDASDETTESTGVVEELPLDTEPLAAEEPPDEPDEPDEPEEVPEPPLARAVDAAFFTSEVRPILEARCIECHGPNKQKGKIRLDAREHAFRNDQAEWLIVPGNAQQSAVIQRVSLPLDDFDIMPPEGDPLTAAQIATLVAWIDGGAPWPQESDETASVEESTRPAEPDPAPAPEKHEPEPPAEDPVAQDTGPEVAGAARAAQEQALAALRDRGAIADRLAQNATWCEVGFGLAKDVGDDDLALLSGLEPVLRRLDLSGSAVTDAGLAALSDFAHLKELRLDRTSVTEAALAHLAELSELEVLNLYATEVGDAGVDHLAGLEALRKVYLFETPVTDDGAAALVQARPELIVVRGN